MENYYELVEELKTFFNVKSLEEVAERLGYKKNNANNWRNNKQLSAQALKKYYELKKANNSVSIHHHKDTITIRYFPDIYASAGFGNANENENFQLINIDKAFLTDVLGVPYKTQYDMIKIYGESMEPFIQNGSFIIIDTTKNSLEKIRNADVVIFRDNDNELFCKRILKNAFDDDIVISSDNFNFGDKKIKKSALKDYVFIGVVVCSCNAKIFLNQIERV
ncbi:S24 family peptidase [Campylobacter jejuni]|nr:S24 family peptidase [Campylobacter jejuni]ECP6059746.1 S24 family peptidase [Campylobacter jejuni]HEB8470069.1 S24/S26 family peptidase [Campylobacter jejuni]